MLASILVVILVIFSAIWGMRIISDYDGNNIQISGGSTSVSNKDGNIVIRGNVRSLRVNGKTYI